METRVANIILGVITALSFVWAYVSEENRIIAIIFSFILIIILIISERNKEISMIKEDIKKLKEKLNIYEQLIDIKSDIKLLKEKNQNERYK